MKGVSIVLMVIGAMTLLGGLGNFDITQIIIGGGFGFGGWTLYKRSLQLAQQKQTMLKRPTQQFQMNDEMIMRLAKRLGGKLSPEQLSEQTSLSFDQAKQRLEAMHNKGICSINLDDIDENGKIYYQF